VLQTLFFNVADDAFRCCRHVVLDVVLRKREKRLLMLDVARNTSRNMAAI
jgi:predicted kinase